VLRRAGHVEPKLARELHDGRLVERVIPGGDFAYEQVLARQCLGSGEKKLRAFQKENG
jgi:hypothetical protein